MLSYKKAQDKIIGMTEPKGIGGWLLLFLIIFSISTIWGVLGALVEVQTDVAALLIVLAAIPFLAVPCLLIFYRKKGSVIFAQIMLVCSALLALVAVSPGFLGNLLWLWYLSRSRRVANTFS